MTSENSRSRQAQDADDGSVRSDAAECDDEDEDDIGIVFTVPAKVSIHDSKCARERKLFFSTKH